MQGGFCIYRTKSLKVQSRSDRRSAALDCLLNKALGAEESTCGGCRDRPNLRWENSGNNSGDKIRSELGEVPLWVTLMLLMKTDDGLG